MKMQGFSLIELLLSIAMIGILAAVSLPVYQGYQNRNDIHVAYDSLSHSLRRAQELSRAMKDDQSWGVYVSTGSIVLFQGTSYASRDADYDEVFTISNGIGVSGIQEVVFDKLTGIPQTIGTTTLSSATGGTKTIFINEKGTVY